MENIILQKTRYLKALMFTMIVGFFAFEGLGQAFSNVSTPALPYNINEDATFEYQADGFNAGTTFLVWLDGVESFDGVPQSSEILNTSTTQGSVVTVNFNWPESSGGYTLSVGGFDGDILQEDALTINVPDNGEGVFLSTAGTNDGNYAYRFDRAGVRRAVSSALDLSSTADKTLSVTLQEIDALDAANALNVQYSTDDGSTFTDLAAVGGTLDGETDLFGFGFETFEFDIPVDDANTIIRVFQAGSNSVAEGAFRWDLENGISIDVGNVYNSILTNNYVATVNPPTVNTTDIEDDGGVSILNGTTYPGEDITVFGSTSEFDYSLVDFQAIIFDQQKGQYVQLANQNVSTNDTGTGLDIEITATVPEDFGYSTNTEVLIVPVEAGSEFGISSFFSSDLDPISIDETIVGGIQNGSSYNFNQTGNRSFTSEIYPIANGDPYIYFEVARSKDQLSPEGTELFIEYSIDEGNTFVRLDTAISLNSISFIGNGFSGVFLDQDFTPDEIAGNDVQLRIVQDNNNGLNLDSWNLTYLQTGTDFIFYDFNVTTTANVDVDRPLISQEPLNIPNSLSYPMTDLTFEYTIDEGVFPPNTPARLLLKRFTNPEEDLVLGNIADVNATPGEIDFQVPPLVANDYDLYLEVNGEIYDAGIALPIYDLGIQISDITSAESFDLSGNETVYPGSEITVSYNIDGTAGSGAELVLSVFDDNLDGNNNGPQNGEPEEFVEIARSTDFNGTISGILPTNVSYNPANVRLSVAGGGVYDNSPFSQTVFPTMTMSDEDVIDAAASVGLGNFGGSDFAAVSANERALVSKSFDLTYGGYVEVELESRSYSSNFTVSLEGSVDGTNWVELTQSTFFFLFDENTIGAIVPNELWSDDFRFRLVYNQNGAFGFQENSVVLFNAFVQTPSFIDLVQDRADLGTYGLNVQVPEINVEDINEFGNELVVNQEVTLNFNAVGFTAETDFAAVLRGGAEDMILGQTTDNGATSIDFTVPLIPQDDFGNYTIEVVPFLPEAAGDLYYEGESIDIDLDEDFLVKQGLNDPNNNTTFTFNQAGNRVLLTRAFDLSQAETAELEFDFNTTSNFSSASNINRIPRLEVSIDGGASFQAIPIYETPEGETAAFADGFFYDQVVTNNGGSFFSVPVPEAYLTEATHFRFSQPLNLGDGENTWEIDNLDLEINAGTALPGNVYGNGNNPLSVSIDAPDASNLQWAQTDLQDAVFNGETFSYDWGYVDGIDMNEVVNFPTGTEFIFTLDGVTDPVTGEDLIIGTSTEFGTFEGTVPLYVPNESYDVRLQAVLDVNGEEVEFYDFPLPDVGDLEVFNQVLKTTFNGNPNDVYYAGNEVTVDYAFENDVTSASIADLQYNLILEYAGDDWLLAVDESLTGSFTVEMPPFVRGAVDFEVRASVGGPLGTIGETLENSGIDLDIAESWLNEEVALVDDNDLPGGTNAELADVSGRRVLTTADFDLVAEEATRLSFLLTVTDGLNQIDIDNVLEDQQLIFEYSTDGGATYTEIETFFTEGDEDGLVSINIPRSYVLDGDMLTSATRFRFRQEESRFDIIIENMSIGSAVDAQVDYVSAGDNGFVPSISPQAIQITSIESDEACLSDEVTLNYEIRGKFGADNMVVVETSGEFSNTITIPSNDLTAYGVNNNNFYTSYANYPLVFNGSNFRRAQTNFDPDVSGGDVVELVVEISTLQNLNTGIDVWAQGFGFYLGTINSAGVHRFSLPANAITTSTDILLNQNDPGSAGDDVWSLESLTLEVSSVGVESVASNIVEGTGSLSFTMPTNLFADGESNKDLKFRLKADDNTFESINLDYEVLGTFTETSLEVVAPVNQDATFTANNPLECNTEDVVATINGMQDYFLYEILDGEGTVLGSLVRDPENPENEINIGQITAATDLELRITAQSSAGNVCNTAVVDEESVEVLANFELYSKLDVDQSWKLVQAEASLNSCNGAGEIELSVRRLLEDGSTTTNNASVEWFRDNLNNLVSTNVSIDDSDMEMSGEYFARLTTGTCVYTTESIQINIEPAPEQPTITVVSGDLAACSSADPVVLEAPEGFAYYQWSNNATTRTITVEDAGSYSVQVSNVPFGAGCSSPSSATIDVDRYETPELSLRDGTSINSSLIADGAEIEACESYTVYFFEDNSYGNSGNLEVIKDGASYATLEGDNNYTIEEEGTYSFVWNYDAINVDGCTVTSNEFTVSILDAPTTAPTLTADGDLNFCEGEGTVTLTAPEGFAYYTWRRGGAAINSTSNGFGSSNVIEVSTDGIYTVTVANSTDGCESPRSNGIDVNVVDEPSIPGLDQVNSTCGDGPVEFSLTNFNGAAMTYQLYNGETGEVSGNPVTIQSGQSGSIFTDVLTENGIPFYVEVMYADGTGCSNLDPSETTTAKVKTISLEVQGSTLIANYDMSEDHVVRWFRNDVLLANAVGSSLTINDAADYMIEVEYDNGCVITASSADIAGKVLANREGMDMQVTSYPNPTQTDVTLNVNSQYMGKHEVIITSMTGQIMLQSSFEKSSFEAKHAMDIANLQEGIYNVQIRHDGLTQNVRIIKK